MKFSFWKNRKKTEYPDEIDQYFKVNNAQVPQDTSFVIFDTESSSLQIDRAELLSIGAVKVKNNSISMKATLHDFVATRNFGANGNIHIHEIMASGKDEKKEVKEVLLNFLKFIGNDTLVAHHARHDVGLINRYLAENFPGVRLVNKVMDTADMAIEKDRQRNHNIKIKSDNYSLDALLKRYNIESVERHTALGDAYSTALLFLKIR